MPRAFNKNKIMKRPFPSSEVYALLEPGPVMILRDKRDRLRNKMK